MNAWIECVVLLLGLSTLGCNPMHTRTQPSIALENLSLPTFKAATSIQRSDVPNTQTGLRLFDDQVLEKALERVWRDNLSIAQSMARLKGASAARDGANASYFPTVDLSSSRSKSESFMFGRTIAQDQWSASVAASYEVDLFDKLGGHRRAAALEHHATKQDLDAVRVTVSATYADLWFQHIEAMKSVRLYRAQRETSQTYFNLTQARFRHGLATATEVLQQRQQLEALATMELPLNARVQLTAHQLHVLEGRVPETVDVIANIDLPAALPVANVTISVSRLMRRPDLAAARLRVQAIDERVGAALANRLPSFRISGNIGVGAQSFSALFDQWLFGITTSLIAPLFDGGRRAADVSQQRALLEQGMYQYRALYLTAIREVKDALVLAHQEDERLERLTTELNTARLLLTEVKRRYTSGVGAYIGVLNALQTLQRKERDYLSARRNQLTHRISLWRALGGMYTKAQGQTATKERQSDSDA